MLKPHLEQFFERDAVEWDFLPLKLKQVTPWSFSFFASVGYAVDGIVDIHSYQLQNLRHGHLNNNSNVWAKRHMFY